MRVWMLRFFGCLAVLGLGLSQARAEDFLEPDQAFKLAVRGAIELQFEIAPGYYMYREQFKLERLDGQALALAMPDGKRKFDETFQKEVETYRDRLTITASGIAAGEELRVTGQGCADKGLCYPPITVRLLPGANGVWRVLPAEEGAPSFGQTRWAEMTTAPMAGVTSPSAVGQAGSEDGALAGLLGSGRWWAVMLGFALAGLGLSLTPCVLPMLPILSSIILGGAQAAPSRSRGLALALAYSGGMVLVYAGLGVAAGLAGEGLAAYLQKPWVLITFALIMVLLALSMFGAYELQLPAGLQQRLTERSQGLSGGRWLPVFGMGALSALIVGPCVAPPLAGALLYISQTRDIWLGGSALFALASGMSVPLLLLGLSAGTLLPRAGAWMEGVKQVFGFGLLAVAIWLAQPALAWPLAQALWGAWLLGMACMCWPTGPWQSRPAQWMRRVAAAGLLFLGLLQWWGAAQGGTDPLRPAATRDVQATAVANGHTPFERVRTLAELENRLRQAGGQPVMLDFYADWCVSCKEMERFTFSDPAVRERLKAALLLQVDVTANSADDRELLRRFKLFGPPAILFFDPEGQERLPLRVIGFQPPERFSQVLTAAGL